jgi:hypothetical protein
MAAAGVGAWVYSKMRRRSGIARDALIVAGFAGLGAFLVIFTVFQFIL